MGHTDDFSSRGVDAGFTYIIIDGVVQVMLTCARRVHHKVGYPGFFKMFTGIGLPFIPFFRVNLVLVR